MKTERIFGSLGVVSILTPILILIISPGTPVRISASSVNCSALHYSEFQDTGCNCVALQSGDGDCPTGKKVNPYYYCLGVGLDVHDCLSKKGSVGYYYGCTRSVNWVNMLTCMGGGASLGSPGGFVGVAIGAAVGMVTCFGCPTINCNVGVRGELIVVTTAYSYQGGCPN